MNDRPDNEGSAAAQTFDLMDLLHMLDPQTLEVRQSVGHGLTVKCPEHGERTGVSVAPCFPISQYGKYLVLKDEAGEELGVLEDMADLSEGSQEAVARELADQHLLPIIKMVTGISSEFHISTWEVETDRGPRRFALRGRHDAHRLGGGRIYIRDAEGNAYLIPDVAKLDPASRRVIETNV